MSPTKTPSALRAAPAYLTRLRSSFIRLATGGDWSATQPAETRRNLIWFWFDGLFASAGDNIVGTYLVVYLLTLGATQGQIGLMSSLSSLSAALMLLPGALLVERMGKRRPLVLLGGGWSRMALLCIALVPLFLQGNLLVYFAIGLAVSRDMMGNLSFPAWMSLTADVVPMEGRGRYFASRNFIMAITGMLTVYLIGILITRVAAPTGYQIAIGIAFMVGMLSVFSFAHLGDHPRIPGPLATPRVKTPGASFFAQAKEIFSHRDFAQFAAVSALWNFSLNIAGPFFTIHLVKNLHADAAMVGLTAIASSVSSMLLQRRLGRLNDHWGARKLTMISGLLIPLVPLAWVFATAAWQIIPTNLLSGALWGAYSLASFNYLLQITPAELRARYSAIYQIIVTVSLAAGAALGSLVVTQFGYPAVFLGSSVGRLLAALLFVLLITRKGPVAEPAAT
jgi:MFS family permease